MTKSNSPSLRTSVGVLLSCLCILVFACTDNATKLSHAIERATKNPADTQTIVYAPKSNPDRPYYLVFFPDRRTRQSDLETAGLPEPLAARVFSEMAYLDVGDESPFLVVVQEDGRLNFTTHWRQFASVPEVLVVPARGTIDLVLKRGARGTIVTVAERP